MRNVQNLLDKLARLENPHKYWRKKLGKNARFCLYQACDECFDQSGIVHKDHKFAGKLNPNKFSYLDDDFKIN